MDHVLGVRHMQTRPISVPFGPTRKKSDLLKNAPLMGEIYGLKVETLPGIESGHSLDDELMKSEVTSCSAILVPGHSPGSLSFLFSRPGAL